MCYRCFSSFHISCFKNLEAQKALKRFVMNFSMCGVLSECYLMDDLTGGSAEYYIGNNAITHKISFGLFGEDELGLVPLFLRNDASDTTSWVFHIARPSWNQMDMAVKDRLSSICSRIYSYVESCDG